MYGKIKFVEYGEDYKVKFVSYGENLKVKYVDFGESQAGNWKVVEFGERYKIKKCLFFSLYSDPKKRRFLFFLSRLSSGDSKSWVMYIR